MEVINMKLRYDSPDQQESRELNISKLEKEIEVIDVKLKYNKSGQNEKHELNVEKLKKEVKVVDIKLKNNNLPPQEKDKLRMQKLKKEVKLIDALLQDSDLSEDQKHHLQLDKLEKGIEGIDLKLRDASLTQQQKLDLEMDQLQKEIEMIDVKLQYNDLNNNLSEHIIRDLQIDKMQKKVEVIDLKLQDTTLSKEEKHRLQNQKLQGNNLQKEMADQQEMANQQIKEEWQELRAKFSNIESEATSGGKFSMESLKPQVAPPTPEKNSQLLYSYEASQISLANEKLQSVKDAPKFEHEFQELELPQEKQGDRSFKQVMEATMGEVPEAQDSRLSKELTVILVQNVQNQAEQATEKQDLEKQLERKQEKSLQQFVAQNPKVKSTTWSKVFNTVGKMLEKPSFNGIKKFGEKLKLASYKIRYGKKSPKEAFKEASVKIDAAHEVNLKSHFIQKETNNTNIRNKPVKKEMGFVQL